MFLDGLWRVDSGCRGSSLAGEVSRPLLFLIEAWPGPANTFLMSDFLFCFGTLNIFCPCLNKHLKCPCHPWDVRGTSDSLHNFSLVNFDIFQEFGGLCFSHLSPSFYADTNPCCHSVWLTEKSVRVSLETSVQSWAWGALSLPLPFLLCTALLCLSERTDSFFVIVPADECLAILSSGGFETDWTNDLSSFVPSLKETLDSDFWKEQFV